ncbi:MAG: type III pantothenate kinase [Desulfurobacteriaceae bacterium]
MEKLLVDVGNTFLKVALEKEGKIKLLKKFSTKKVLKCPKILSDLCNVKIERTGISSVVKELNPILKKIFKDALFISANTPLPIKINYKNKRLLGADRIANACGGLLYGDSFSVVSVGTTVVVDLVKDRVFEGGVIFPGFELMAESLSLKTSQLPKVESFKKTGIPSKSTVECIENGVLLSIVGGIKEALSIYKTEKVIITGGGGYLVKDFIKDAIYIDNLTFEGISRIIDHQKAL